jgi:hypothetical protein
VDALPPPGWPEMCADHYFIPRDHLIIQMGQPDEVLVEPVSTPLLQIEPTAVPLPHNDLPQHLIGRRGGVKKLWFVAACTHRWRYYIWPISPKPMRQQSIASQKCNDVAGL